MEVIVQQGERPGGKKQHNTVRACGALHLLTWQPICQQYDLR